MKKIFIYILMIPLSGIIYLGWYSHSLRAECDKARDSILADAEYIEKWRGKEKPKWNIITGNNDYQERLVTSLENISKDLHEIKERILLRDTIPFVIEMQTMTNLTPRTQTLEYPTHRP